jgi:hypothetical protein
MAFYLSNFIGVATFEASFRSVCASTPLFQDLHRESFLRTFRTALVSSHTFHFSSSSQSQKLNMITIMFLAVQLHAICDGKESAAELVVWT